MKASLKWINKYVNISDLTPEEIANKLTFAGVEVESIDYVAQGTNLVIGEILSCEAHPDSDHLHVLNVDEGKYGIHQIVCGAPNARKGLKVIVAREGAKLPEVTIQKGVIRGVESDGMCCSLVELGVDKKYLAEKQIAGIEELPADAPVGEDNVLGYLGLDDVVLDLSLLANRADLYSIANIAREIACLFDREVKLPEPKAAKLEKSDFVVGSETTACPQFAIREVKGIKVKPSPAWLSQALLAQGIRSINNVVDIGNYVMLLTGEPLNMYDLDKLPSKSLIVRDDIEGDFVAMDDKAYPLIKGDLLVTSEGKGMCLAGVMTAQACMVDENTKNVAVESAYFKGASIRHTSNRIGLASDSSMRFVKGVNPSQTEYVLSIATDLLVELADAEVVYETKNYDTINHEPKVIESTYSYINGRLGTSFTKDEILAVLKKDYLNPIETGDGSFTITVPSYRIDMDGQADISEEVIRILGYENVHSSLPTVRLSLTGLTPTQIDKRAIRRYLRENGIDEGLTYTLVNDKMIKQYDYITKGEPWVLSNPLTVDRSIVRKHMVPSLLDAVEFNVNRQNKDVALFEISDIDAKGVATSHLAIALTGVNKTQGLLEKHNYDFYDMKGYVEGILQLLNLSWNRIQLVPWSLGGNELHPGKSAELRMGKQLLGYFGELHPTELKNRGLKSGVVLELDLDALLAMKTSPIKASAPSKFQRVNRDLALVVNKEVTFEQLYKAIKKTDSLIKDVDVFDVYEGEHVAEGKKSIAISISFGSDEKTLSDEEISALVNKVISALKVAFGADIRS